LTRKLLINSKSVKIWKKCQLLKVFQIGFTTPTNFPAIFQNVYLFFLGGIQNSGLIYFRKALTCGVRLSAANMPHAAY
jgi:hypothetical protein